MLAVVDDHTPMTLICADNLTDFAAGKGIIRGVRIISAVRDGCEQGGQPLLDPGTGHGPRHFKY